MSRIIIQKIEGEKMDKLDSEVVILPEGVGSIPTGVATTPTDIADKIPEGIKYTDLNIETPKSTDKVV
jgi:hypothetical protein